MTGGRGGAVVGAIVAAKKSREFGIVAPSGPKHSRNLSARRRLSACQLGPKANAHGKKAGLRSRYSKTTNAQPKHHHAQPHDTKRNTATIPPHNRKPTPELATVSLVDRGWGALNARVCSMMRDRSTLRANPGMWIDLPPYTH